MCELHAATHAQATLPPPAETVLDPVCGMRIAPQDAAARLVHEGVEHHFCSAGCARRFQADPQRYLRTAETPAPAAAEPAAAEPATAVPA
jgi:Cu+-exporting ATPase